MEPRKSLVGGSLWREVLSRDKNICQCCGETRFLEIHHIKPVVYGGKNEAENLVILCSSCHYYAPSKPEEFSKYLQVGGANSAIKLAYLLREFARQSPDMKISEFLSTFDGAKSLFMEYQVIQSESQSQEKAPSKASIDREKVLAVLKDNPEQWFVANHLNNLAGIINASLRLNELYLKDLVLMRIEPRPYRKTVREFKVFKIK